MADLVTFVPELLSSLLKEKTRALRPRVDEEGLKVYLYTID